MVNPGVLGEALVRKAGSRRPLRRLSRFDMASRSTANSTALEPFSAPVRRWFEASFEAPTPAQDKGWPAIASGDNTLICAPTGSGKTLTAFLWGIDTLSRRAAPDPDAATEDPEALGQGIRLVYVSPLKALSYDVDRNLRAPLKGIGAPIKVGLRTGDTPQKDRQAMLRKPPDILITTPESLYLMLTSRAQEILTNVDAVIVDEIHAVAQTKRGAHLALTLERLDHLVRTHEDGRGPDATVQRIGLSATQRPLGEGRQLPGRAEAEVHRRQRRHPQEARPGDRRPRRGHDGPGRGVRHLYRQGV